MNVLRQIGKTVEEKIGRRVRKTRAAESVSDSASKRAGVARGLDVDIGIAEHHQFARRQIKIAQQSVKAYGIRLFLFETVAAIYELKIRAQIQASDDGLAELHGFVGEHGE